MPRPLRESVIARDFILKRMAAAQLADSDTLTGLALLAGVSYATMWGVIAQMKKMGEWRVKAPKQHGQKEKAKHASRRVLDEVARDLLSGTIVRDDRLLSVKELASRYGASPHTIRKVAAILYNQGLLSRIGGHYGPRKHQSRLVRTMVFITRTQHSFGIVLNETEIMLLRALESLCENAGMIFKPLVLRTQASSWWLTNPATSEREKLPADERVSGYVYLITDHEGYDESLVHELIRTRLPIAIVDKADVFPHHNPSFNLPRLKVFVAQDLQEPGKAMARYLLNKGHRHIAYISASEFEPWSHQRFEGARQIITLAGQDVSLSVFTTDSITNFNDFYSIGQKAINSTRIEKSLLRWIENLPKKYGAAIYGVYGTDMRNHLIAVGVTETMQPLLDAAAVHREITAWILPNDHAAFMALSYCVKKGISVPARVAIVGFDDILGAATMRLTSYNFNIEATASTVFNFLLWPKAAIWRKAGVNVIQGRVVGRESG